MSSKKEFPTFGVLTLGCKVNQYESEAIAEGLEQLGFVQLPSFKPCDLYILNTCTVTAESDRKSRQMTRRLIQKNPEALVMVTGCSTQAHAAAFALAHAETALAMAMHPAAFPVMFLAMMTAALAMMPMPMMVMTSATTMIAADSAAQGFRRFFISNFMIHSSPPQRT